MRLVCSLTIRWKMWLVLLRTQGRITNAPAAGKYTAMNVKQENFAKYKKMQKSIRRLWKQGQDIRTLTVAS